MVADDFQQCMQFFIHQCQLFLIQLPFTSCNTRGFLYGIIIASESGKRSKLRGAPNAWHCRMAKRTVTRQGKDKRMWLYLDGREARIADLDTYVLNHRRRMKPCTSFDKLDMDSGENQEFGSKAADYVHFNASIGEAIRALEADYPAETARYAGAFEVSDDSALAERIRLINPMNFIGTDEQSRQAKRFRIRVGASDADTSFSVSMTLALKLQNAGLPTDFAFVWDQPHSEADYPGEVLDWIDSIIREEEK